MRFDDNTVVATVSYQVFPDVYILILRRRFHRFTYSFLRVHCPWSFTPLRYQKRVSRENSGQIRWLQHLVGDRCNNLSRDFVSHVGKFIGYLETCRTQRTVYWILSRSLGSRFCCRGIATLSHY